jgi:hypothetical protein
MPVLESLLNIPVVLKERLSVAVCEAIIVFVMVVEIAGVVMSLTTKPLPRIEEAELVKVLLVKVIFPVVPITFCDPRLRVDVKGDEIETTGLCGLVLFTEILFPAEIVVDPVPVGP